MQFFPQPEGYVRHNAGVYEYIYQYKDHLGNTRLSYNKNLNIIEENNYYPFGLQQKSHTDIVSTQGNSTAQKYKYNGKELQDDNIGGSQLNLYDYGARNYDPAIGRWMNIDPLAEKSRRFSPYTYVLNNPIYFIDPDGMVEVPYKSRYDAYGQKIDQQEAPIGNNTEIGPNNRNDIDQESTDSESEFNDKTDEIQKQDEENINLVELFEKVLSNKVGTTLTSNQIIKRYHLPKRLQNAINSIKLVSKNKIYIDWNNENTINKLSNINVKDGILSIKRGFIPTTPKAKLGQNGYIITGAGLNYQPSIWSSETFSPVFVQSTGIYGYFPETNTKTEEGAGL